MAGGAGRRRAGGRWPERRKRAETIGGEGGAGKRGGGDGRGDKRGGRTEGARRPRRRAKTDRAAAPSPGPAAAAGGGSIGGGSWAAAAAGEAAAAPAGEAAAAAAAAARNARLRRFSLAAPGLRPASGPAGKAAPKTASAAGAAGAAPLLARASPRASGADRAPRRARARGRRRARGRGWSLHHARARQRGFVAPVQAPARTRPGAGPRRERGSRGTAPARASGQRRPRRDPRAPAGPPRRSDLPCRTWTRTAGPAGNPPDHFAWDLPRPAAGLDAGQPAGRATSRATRRGHRPRGQDCRRAAQKLETRSVRQVVNCSKAPLRTAPFPAPPPPLDSIANSAERRAPRLPSSATAPAFDSVRCQRFQV